MSIICSVKIPEYSVAKLEFFKYCKMKLQERIND